MGLQQQRAPGNGAADELGSLSAQEITLIEKFRRAGALSASGHRVTLSVMFYSDAGPCDMTIEDRERIAAGG